MRWDNLEIVDQRNNLAYGGTRADRPKTMHGRLDSGTQASRPIFYTCGRDARAPALERDARAPELQRTFA